MSSNLIFVVGAGILAMLFSFWKTSWINKQDEGTERMKQIGASIADGAMAFLSAEYRVLAIFVISVALVLGIANSGRNDSSALISMSFIVGAIASGLAGYLGMKVATKANNRTTNPTDWSWIWVAACKVPTTRPTTRITSNTGPVLLPPRGRATGQRRRDDSARRKKNVAVSMSPVTSQT